MILLPLFRLCREEAVFPGSKRSVALRFADGRKRGACLPMGGTPRRTACLSHSTEAALLPLSAGTRRRTSHLNPRKPGYPFRMGRNQRRAVLLCRPRGTGGAAGKAPFHFLGASPSPVFRTPPAGSRSPSSLSRFRAYSSYSRRTPGSVKGRSTS